ncbi:MAG: acyl-CoA dehydrogenase C-terminal domain-containing protein, partial [Paracoccaceae bacterium]
VSQKDMNDRFAGAVPFLFAFARVLGSCAHLRAAMVCGPDHARTRLARFYITRMLPEYEAALAEARSGASDLYALTVEDLTA